MARRSEWSAPDSVGGWGTTLRRYRTGIGKIPFSGDNRHDRTDCQGVQSLTTRYDVTADVLLLLGERERAAAPDRFDRVYEERRLRVNGGATDRHHQKD